MFNELRTELQELLDSGISREEAINYVAQAVEDQKTKRRATIQEAVDIAASHTASLAIRDHRRSICQRAETITRSRENGSAILKERVAGLMGFRLPNGAPLSDSTGDECMEASEHYMKSAQCHFHRAEFLRDIANRAGKKLVGKVLTESDLQDSYENARRLP